MRFLRTIAFSALCCACGITAAQGVNATFPKVECTHLHRFSKAQKDHLIYAYNFGAPKGMGYTMAAIAWQESCAGVYMINFSDPSAGIYHAHIPVVLKYYSGYKDTAFTRNVMGQLLINDRKFASQVALDSLLYWQRYHKGNYKNIIKSYNKGFKWEKDRASNKLAESYYLGISKKVRALESFIPRYSKVKNQSTFLEIQDKNKKAAATQKAVQEAKEAKELAKDLQNAKSKQKGTKELRESSPKEPNPNQQEFLDLPLNGTPLSSTKAQNTTPRQDNPKAKPSASNPAQSSSTKSNPTSNTTPPKPGNFDESFEDFQLFFEGHSP